MIEYARIRRATEEEKGQYDGIYPLHSIIMWGDKIGHLEDLRGTWAKPDPQWEVMAPIGFHFYPDFTHSLLCGNLQDVKESIRCEFKPCKIGECF